MAAGAMAARTTNSLQSGSQSYENVAARDNATVINGNVYEYVAFNSDAPNEKKDDDKAIKCRDLLFLTDPENDRATLISAKGKRVANTCEWIREDEAYRGWLNGNHQLLWICGGPGKGKTMLSIFLTEELEAENEILYFFCTAGDENRNNAAAILRGLLWQLINRRLELVQAIHGYFETDVKTQATLQSLESLWAIFVKLLKTVSSITVFCILDGLEECDLESIRWLVDKLEDVDLSPTEMNNLRLAIVSRDIVALRSLNTIRLDPDNNEQVSRDIQAFISMKVQKLSTMIGFESGFRDKIRDMLLERAEGTFLWVGLVMDELFRKRTCTQAQVEKAIQRMPKALPGLYSRMLLEIDPEERETSARIIRWATLAVRPLSVDELASALGIADSAFLGARRAILDQIDICRPFVRVDESNDEVVLVHQSARDYLLRESTDEDPVLESFRIKPEEAHADLAQECVGFLIRWLPSLRSLPHETRWKYYTDERLIFLDYSIQYWPEHARFSRTCGSRLMTKSKVFFQEQSPCRREWYLRYLRCSRIASDTAPNCDSSPMHLACFLGMTSWVKVLIEEILDTSRHQSRRHGVDGTQKVTPLQYAVYWGHLDIVKLLLGSGAKVDLRCWNFGTALSLAFHLNYEAIARELIAHGADINVETSDLTCLGFAVLNKNERMVQLAIDSGADVDARAVRWGGSALYLAANRGYKPVMRVLLEAGASVDVRDADGATVFYRFGLRDETEVTQLLVDYGADVNAKDSDGWTLLHRGAQFNLVSAVRFLLDAGANVNCERSGETPLHILTRKAPLELANWADRAITAQILLDHGADCYLKDGHGRTARECAVEVGAKEIVTLLDNFRAGLVTRHDSRFSGSAESDEWQFVA